jgi:hypothetical protein
MGVVFVAYLFVGTIERLNLINTEEVNAEFVKNINRFLTPSLSEGEPRHGNFNTHRMLKTESSNFLLMT